MVKDNLALVLDPVEETHRDTLTSQTKDFPDNLGSRFIHEQQLLVLFGALVTIGDRAAAPHAVFHPGFEYRLDFVAGIFRIPLVHDVQKRGKVIV